MPTQEQTLIDIETKWRESGYTDFKTYEAQDSGDVLLVGTGKDAEPVAARVNSLGSAKVGPANSPGMGQPLKPLAPDHPNYEWEQSDAPNPFAA